MNKPASVGIAIVVMLVCLVGAGIAITRLATKQNSALPGAPATGFPGAQAGGPPPSAQAVEQQLGLTSAQIQSVEALRQSMRQQMMALRQDTTLSQQDRRSKMDAIRQSTGATLQTILTAAQWAHLQQLGGPRALFPRRRPGRTWRAGWRHGRCWRRRLRRRCPRRIWWRRTGARRRGQWWRATPE
jgi:uncharacterized membrane protein